MSRLEELIQQLCPDGVKVVELGAFAKVQTEKNKNCACNRAYSITQKGLMPTNEYFKEAKVTSEDTSGYKIVKKHWFVYSPSRIDVGSINYLQDEDDVIVSPLNVVFSVNENVVDVKYLLTFLNSRKGTWQILGKREGIEGTGRKMLPFTRFSTIEVPLPPLPVQQEIVRILDSFTEVTTELTAELTARKKQYAYYRKELLTFRNNVSHKTLSEVCMISAGGDVPKEAMSKNKTEKYFIPIISNGTEENAVYGYTNIVKVNAPAVTVAARGTIGYAAYRDYPYYPIIRLLSVIPKETSALDVKYLYYCLKDQQYKIPKSGIPQLTAPELKKVEIPVPTLEEQHRIVSILDRFDALCNDLTSGLPAEIEARKKQYEYYRDRLLTFKNKER